MSEFRNRVVAPFVVPLLGLIGLAIFVLAFSRVLLAVPKYWSVTLAGIISAEILGVGAVVAAVRKVSGAQRVLIGLLGAIVLVGGGAGFASGIRPIEHHGGEVISIAAVNLVFDTDTLLVPAETEFELEFVNDDPNIPHNVAIYTDESAAEQLFIGEIFNGVATQIYTVPPLPEGDSFFRCDIHPDMKGIVRAGGEGHGGTGETGGHGTEPSVAPSGDAGQHDVVTVESNSLVFDTDTITVPANAEIHLEFVNNDANVPHNIAIYTDESATSSIFVGETFNGVATKTYVFDSPDAGEYYFRCDVHPTMEGKFVTQ